MKKLIVTLSAIAVLGSIAPACNYGGMAVAADGRILVARGDHFLSEGMRATYVCDLEEAGLVNCAESPESP